jgi:hypothetical protein
MNPAAGVASVGTLWHGGSIADGSYRQLIAKRKPMVISIDLPFVSQAADTVKDPNSIASVRQSVNRLLQGASNATPAQISSNMESIYSLEQAAMKSHISASGWGSNLKASFDFSNTSIKSRLLVKFIQKYYTINADLPPNGVCDFFEVLPNLSQIDVPPVYTSSVTYGRIAYLFIESTSFEHELKWAVEATVKAYGVTVNGGVSQEQKNVINNAKINAFVLGGNGRAGAEAVTGFEGFKNYISQGGNFSKDSPGAPISYVLSYLDNNKVANVKLSSTYVVRNCTEKSAEEMIFTPVNTAVYSANFFKLTGYYAFGPLQNRDWCPNLDCGDGEFDGNGPVVTGKIKLSHEDTNQGTEIWGDFQFAFDEFYDTHAYVKQKVKLFVLPKNKRFVDFASQPVANLVQYIDNDVIAHDKIPMDGDIVEDCIINGDTGGDDVPCHDVGGDQSWIAIKFKPIRIMVK